jgi:hypothetical protein
VARSRPRGSTLLLTRGPGDHRGRGERDASTTTLGALLSIASMRALVATSGSRHPSEATYLSARITTAVARHVLSIVEGTKASDVVSLRGRGNRILTLWMNIP